MAAGKSPTLGKNSAYSQFIPSTSMHHVILTNILYTVAERMEENLLHIANILRCKYNKGYLITAKMIIMVTLLNIEIMNVH